MNSFLTLTLLCLLTVAQVFSQNPSSGASSLVGSISGGASDANPAPTRWIEFMDMDNDWSKLGNLFTFEAWIWHSNQGASNWQPILSRHPGMNAHKAFAHFALVVRDRSILEVYAGCGCQQDGTGCGNGYVLSNSGTFLPEVWQHVAVTFEGDGTTSTSTAALYINGLRVDQTIWGAQNTVCTGRSMQFARYADVSVGYLDDEVTNVANAANPDMIKGWWGRIDEIRFWLGVRTAKQIGDYRDVGLKGTESGLFAYYQFSPEQAVLQDPTAPKTIENEVGDWLHGLPQPDPTNSQIFTQVTNLRIDSYTQVFGQSELDEDLPPYPNNVEYESWPEEDGVNYGVLTPYSNGLQSLIASGHARLYGDPTDLSVTVFVTCPNNDCSFYEQNWKDYYFDYQATYNGVGVPPARMYLRISTLCPSGVFDDCGVCEGDNSQCQCVIYHGFESERMSYILFQWSLSNLIEEVTDTIATLDSTMDLLDLETTDVDQAVLRQQISDLMTFYNGEMTDYCGDLSAFMSELQSVVPRSPESLINEGANSSVDGSLPFIPSFPLPPTA